MNRNEYDSGNYTGSSYRQPPPNRGPYHAGHYRNPSSLAASSRYEYGVDSMLSPPRSLQQRDYGGGGGGWEQRSRVATPYERRGSDVSQLRSQYTRLEPRFRDHPPHSYHSSSGVDASPTRREYSPLRHNASKGGFDGVFKGFTSALPGNDPGYAAADAADLVDHGGSVRTPTSRRYSEVDRASLYRGLSTAAPPTGVPVVAATSMPAAGNDLYGHESRYRYRGPVDGRPEYGAAASNHSYQMDDYAAEPTSRYQHEANNRYDEPAASYAPPSASSSANGRRPADYYRWEATANTPSPPPSAPCWDVGAEPASPRMGEQPLSPRTFKRECQRAFKEARAQRMRNLEEGLYGKCDWATFDAKYC